MNTAISLDGTQAILTFAFKDPRWMMKLLIGTLLGFAGRFIPILPGILVLGYCATIMRGIIVDNAGASLPEWDDWGNLFSRGLKLFGVMAIFLLPVLIFLVGGYFMMAGPIYFNVITENSNSMGHSGLGSFQVLMMFIGMAMFFLGLILCLPIGLVLPVAISHSVAKDSFAAAFHFREQWKILRANLGGFLTCLALIIGIYYLLITGMQIIYFTVILCCLLPFVMSIAMFYMSLVSAAASAEAYRRGVEKSAPALAIDTDSLLSSD